MKTLYYVSTYNRERNERARFAVSALNVEEACEIVLDNMGDRWSVSKTLLICATPADNVFMEL